VNLDISIIIISWNTHDLLLNCLTSLIGHTTSSRYEIFVVDNASSDGSAAMVYENFPQVHIIENLENVGFARANNQAIIQATGRYILFLNSDTVLKPYALDELVTFMDEHPEAGAAGARLRNPDGTLQSSCYPRPTLIRESMRMFHLDKIWPNGSYHMAEWEQDMPREVDVLQGACVILRMKALEKTGLLDERFFFYSEDVDLCFRLQKAGYHLCWVPKAEVIHYGGQSSQLAADETFLSLYQCKLLYMRKHYGRLSSLVYKLILLIASLSRVLLAPFTLIEHPSLRQRHLTLAVRYLRLLVSLPGM
jgi:GT2 family glycosyltransferase